MILLAWRVFEPGLDLHSICVSTCYEWMMDYSWRRSCCLHACQVHCTCNKEGWWITPYARILVVHQAGEGGMATCLLVRSRSKLNCSSEHQQYSQTHVRAQNKSVLSVNSEVSVLDIWHITVLQHPTAYLGKGARLLMARVRVSTACGQKL